MREILFRGKSAYTGKWIEGVPVPLKINNYDTTQIAMVKYHNYEELENYSLYSEDELVKPETIGQFTGLLDKNGKKIFEGDIIKTSIYYDIGCYPHSDTEVFKVVIPDIYRKRIDGAIEVIGNIHDNPELLKERY